MAWPTRDDTDYRKKVDAYNARRRKRREDEAYKAKETARQRASKARLAERRKAEEWERRHGKEG
ncbi:hypothetical protein MCNS_01620 [Mycobacterium conspicuum]|uniref:Uncharacterized protein n=1 Tax=Mycobacterium conspicuum TaxID=44010 RepID=A0A7I7Y622_9MYCO|nr:hypothetical protein MCNS_01620 [Mycobacterium conspicuum]